MKMSKCGESWVVKGSGWVQWEVFVVVEDI